MRFDKFTLKAQTAIEQAQNVADRRSHQELSPIHLLVALLGQSEGVVRPILEKFGARPLKRAIQRLIQNPLALKILDGEVLPGEHVLVDGNLKKGQMSFERAAARAAR